MASNPGGRLGLPVAACAVYKGSVMKIDPRLGTELAG